MEDKIVQSLATIADSLNNGETLKEIIVSFEAVIKLVAETKQLTEQEIENLRSMFNEAVKETKSINNDNFLTLKARLMSYCEEEMSKMAKSHEQMMKKCDDKMSEMKDGKDADEEKIKEEVIQEVLSKIPEPEPVEEETPESVRDMLETLEGEERLDISAIKGFDKTLEDIKNSKTVRLTGGKMGVQLYVNGVKKGLAQYIDIVQGSNVTISDNLVNGLHTLTISSTGGSGFTQLSATETPDGSITVFTFSTASAQPSFLVVDNVWMKATTATGGVNWTWNNGTKKATLTIPAVDDIWGVV